METPADLSCTLKFQVSTLFLRTYDGISASSTLPIVWIHLNKTFLSHTSSGCYSFALSLFFISSLIDDPHTEHHHHTQAQQHPVQWQFRLLCFSGGYQNTAFQFHITPRSLRSLGRWNVIRANVHPSWNWGFCSEPKNLAGSARTVPLDWARPWWGASW